MEKQRDEWKEGGIKRGKEREKGMEGDKDKERKRGGLRCQNIK